MRELETVFEALTDRRRRLALYYLQKHQTLTLPDLAELLVEDEHETDVRSLSGEQIRDAYLSFYHRHLPKLEQAGLVCYDQEEDRLVRTEQCSTALRSVRDEVKRLQTA